MRIRAWIIALMALALVAAACGRDSDDAADTTTTVAPATTAATDDGGDGDTGGTDGDPTPTTEAPPTDPCEATALEETEIGVSADTITVLVMADVGSPLAPGLFQGSLDGTKAWAEKVNANGGLACREVVVEEYDSQINPQESTNGILRACENALAMVGSTALFVTDVTDLNTCPDMAGAATGIPDLPERAVDAQHQCSPNVFSVASVNGSCPYAGDGPRDWVAIVGPYAWLQETAGPLNGVYLLPGDLRNTIATTMPTLRGQEAAGLTIDGMFPVSGSADQATYGQYVQAMLANNSNFGQTGSDDQSILKLRREAVLQGVDVDSVNWFCSVACYTPAFLGSEPEAIEGTYLWLPFLPFDEGDVNPETAAFIEGMGDSQPASWAAGAWAAGVLFEQAVNAIVEADGPNGLTRVRLLDELTAMSEFSANGMFGSISPAAKETSPCFVMMQVQDGAFVRVYPEERGTFDCEAGNLSSMVGYDALADFDSL